ncbi:MAG: GGDEF domain-containing protein [Gammaproteobacteria bacterium]|jgi:diguanylate cyclase (GGDEF)-like protein|nr:GGDEF domain-containing protein [Gammaproteobacteria bacterium]
MPRGQDIKEAGAFSAEAGDLALMYRTIDSGSCIPGGTSTALQLASVLQTSLDVDRLIEIFSRHIQHLVPHGSMSFENRALQLSVSKGTPEKYSRSYQLVVTAQTLGILTVTRRTRLTAAEGELLEHLSCCLVYPLRNAIMYRSAVMAALRDPLTGINNRTAMNSALIRETELARRYGAPLSLIALDVDHFKAINDRHGHLAGDHVLKCVAEAISECTRSSDMFFRSGGEEFLIVASNTARDGAMMLGERIRRRIESLECQYGEEPVPVTISLGIACYRPGDNSESLFEKADTALYAAKSAGRNCVKFQD